MKRDKEEKKGEKDFVGNLNFEMVSVFQKGRREGGKGKISHLEASSKKIEVRTGRDWIWGRNRVNEGGRKERRKQQNAQKKNKNKKTKAKKKKKKKKKKTPAIIEMKEYYNNIRYHTPNQDNRYKPPSKSFLLCSCRVGFCAPFFFFWGGGGFAINRELSFIFEFWGAKKAKNVEWAMEMAMNSSF